MTMRSEKLAVLTGAIAFTIGLIGLTLWFVRSWGSTNTVDPTRVSAPAVANAHEELDPVLHERRKRVPASSAKDETIAAVLHASQSRAVVAGAEATLIVHVAEPPEGSHWMISFDVQGLRAGAPVRRTATTLGTNDARFEHVPVGPIVEVLALESRGKQMPRRMRIGPPLTPGEVREVSLVQLVEAAVVFRVLDPSGAPCKEAWIEARVTHGLAGSSSDDMHALHTDIEGRVRLVLEAPESAATERWLCVHAHDLQVAGVETTEHYVCEFPLTCELPRRDTDVGDVQLAPEPVVASGIVVVPTKHEILHTITVAAVVLGRTGSPLHQLAEAGHDDSIPLETHVDGEGHFEVRSALHSGMIAMTAMPELFARTDMVAGPIVTVPFGTHDIRLIVEIGGSISGTVVGAELRPPTIEVRCPDVDAPLGIGSACMVGAGSFRFDRLAAGVHRIELRPSGELLSTVPLIAIDGVVVVADKDTQDPRLQSIDVTPLVRRLRIDLVDQDGQHVLEGACRFLRAGTVIGRNEFSRARIDVAVGRAPIDIEIEAPGFEIAHASDVQDGQRIALKRGRLLRLKLASRDLLETLQNVKVFVHLVPEGEAHGRSDLRSCLDEGGETNFTDIARGKWRVDLELDVDCYAPGPHVHVRTEHPRIVDVSDEPTIEVSLDVSEDAIAVARASLPD